jgi:hypothetical protein
MHCRDLATQWRSKDGGVLLSVKQLTPQFHSSEAVKVDIYVYLGPPLKVVFGGPNSGSGAVPNMYYGYNTCMLKLGFCAIPACLTKLEGKFCLFGK